MKLFFLFTFLIFSTQAFSENNSYNEYCQFDSPKGEVIFHKRIYWSGNHMVLMSDIPGIDDYPSVYLHGSEVRDYDDPVNGEEVMVFSLINDFNKVILPYDDGCWQGFTAEFERAVKIEDLKPIITKVLNFKKNDQLQLKCSYEHLEISGDRCDEF